jgi:uncharacterized membrane protein YdbT with pleckstrin-like domain
MRVQEGEEALHELRPEPGVLGIWFFTRCVPAAFIAAFFGFWCYGFLGGLLGYSFWPVAGGGIIMLIAALVVLILGVVYCVYLRRTYVYYVTNQRCIFHGGILRRVERSVPYHKITDVEMSQNIIERAFGISTLKIFTPGTGSMVASPFWFSGGQRAEISFVGLKDSETPAATVNERLRKYRATGE